MSPQVYACSAVALLHRYDKHLHGSKKKVYLFLFFAVTAKMEDSVSKLEIFSKLDFKWKQEVINNGRTMPELKGLLQTTRQKITCSFQTEWYTQKGWLCGQTFKTKRFSLLRQSHRDFCLERWANIYDLQVRVRPCIHCCTVHDKYMRVMINTILYKTR